MKLYFAIFGCLLFSGTCTAQTEPALKNDFSNVANFGSAKKSLALEKLQLEAIRKNLFVVVPDDNWSLDSVYGLNDYDNLPSLVTTDNVLQIFHIFFDSTLRHSEEHHLSADIKKLSSQMLSQAETRYQRVRSTNLAIPALKNVAYFAVANRLLGGKPVLPKEASKMVAREYDLIENAHDVSDSAIFPYRIDYTQFIVRGHYGRSLALRRYFRALMWFSLAPLAIEKEGQPMAEQIRQSALMVQDLYDSGAISLWQRIYNVTAMYVGGSNDLTPGQWREAVRPVLGWPQSLSTLSKPESPKEIDRVVKKMAHPLIVNKALNRTAVGDVVFRFMGQRAIADSVVFNKLTGIERPKPSPLDVATAFGSNRAAKILDADPDRYNPKHWSDYESVRSNTASEIAAWKTSDWTKNLYTGSLDLMRLTLQKPSPKAPKFMQSSAWADKSISSSLAFWAELRHDTILYGTQPQAAEQGGDDPPPPFVKGYIEPNVPLYERMVALLTQMQSGLSQFKYLNSNELAEFLSFKETLGFFASASKRELVGVKLSKGEYVRIRKIEGELGSLSYTIQIIGENYKVLSNDDSDMALIADVATFNDQALEVATGHSDKLIAIVPIEGKLCLACGSVYSFYEFDVPIGERVSDHDWKQRLQNHQAPPRPKWIGGYFVDTTKAMGH